MTTRPLGVLFCVLAALAAACGGPGVADDSIWDAEGVDRIRHLRIQSEGRVKPLDSFVRYTMLRVNGRRSLTLEEGDTKRRVHAMEWALDVMLRPRIAQGYRCILVENSEVLQTIGLADLATKKRDRYSYAGIAPGIPKLGEFYDSYAHIEAKNREPIQNLVVNVGRAIIAYQGLQGAFTFAREEFDVDGSEALKSAFGGRATARFSEVLMRSHRLGETYRALDRARAEGGAERDPKSEAEFTAMRELISRFFAVAEDGRQLAWLPPLDEDDEEWMTVQDLVSAVTMSGPEKFTKYIDAIRRAEAMYLAVGKPEFEQRAGALVDATESILDARDQRTVVAPLAPLWSTVLILGGMLCSYLTLRRGIRWWITVPVLVVATLSVRFIDLNLDKNALEVTYHDQDFFYKTLVVSMFAFLLAAFSWLKPRAAMLGTLTKGTVALATLILVAGIVVRCVLRERPPVTTLYETILFVAAIGIAAGLLIETFNNRKVAISVAALVGAVGMFLAGKFEEIDKQDTLPQLVAVLDTNFWLSTHVITVTLGYGAALLAGFLAHVYLIGKLLGVRRNDYAFYRNIGRMVYGVICFGLVFSTVGTILGGIWANYSWGRFWGWDPKENGALLIVLCELVILHGRLGGLWRDFGVCLLAVLGNIVVAFSWWGVNLMSVGLHSYGFTSELKTAATTFYISQAVVFGLGALAWFMQRQRAQILAQARAELTDAAPPAADPA